MSCSRITNYFTTSLPCLWCGRLWVVAFYLHMYAQFFLHHILRNITLLKKKFWNNLHSYFLYFLPCCFTQTQNLFFFFSSTCSLLPHLLIFLFFYFPPHKATNSLTFLYIFIFFYFPPHKTTHTNRSLLLPLSTPYFPLKYSELRKFYEKLCILYVWIA